MSKPFYFLRLAARNLLRHKLRSGLTVLGMVVTVTAFALLRTVVDAWYAGAEATSAQRLITRNAISLVVPLPISYLNKIRRVDGVAAASYASWFAGVYINERNFFPQFAIEPRSYLDLYPEFILPDDERQAFPRDRKGAIAGRKLVREYGWEVGDVIPLRGTIYPGHWGFVLRGIYAGAEPKVDETNFLFHWDHLNETLRAQGGPRADHVGIFLAGVERAEDAAEVSLAIDAQFKNSLAETLTETEKAFQLGFVAMTEAILLVVQAVSFIVIVIILAVVANTMTMSVRERRREYATLKALGFGAVPIAGLIMSEAVLLSLLGGGFGLLCSVPIAEAFGARFGTLFPIFIISNTTRVASLSAALTVGVIAAAIASAHALRIPLASALRGVQ